jgi:hypothetical protein
MALIPLVVILLPLVAAAHTSVMGLCDQHCLVLSSCHSEPMLYYSLKPFIREPRIKLRIRHHISVMKNTAQHICPRT